MEGLGLRAPRGRRGPAVIVLALAVVVSACTGEVADATGSPSQPTTPPNASPSLTSPDAQPSDAEESLLPEETPAETPLATPAPAASCTGTDANKAFFATVAAGVAWDVYCPVLPKGWSVDTGSYRTSGGGWLKITYKASGGRRFELREGAFCTDPATCAPTGVEIAPGPFGDREATVVQVEDGGFAMLVDHGEKISWVAVGKGIDEPTFRAHAEALILVGE